MSIVTAVHEERIRLIQEGTVGGGPVLYWMERDQRAHDNWALLFAQELAARHRRPLVVAFCLAPMIGRMRRQAAFMLGGLEILEAELAGYRIPFVLLEGDPAVELPRYAREKNAAALVTDFSPLRMQRRWKERVTQAVTMPFYEVDAHNIVPCRVASPKAEYGAYTLRPKITRLLPAFLTGFPALLRQPDGDIPLQPVEWERIRRVHGIGAATQNDSSLPVPGAAAASALLEHFLTSKIARYAEERNTPERDGQSHLSPYLHFGQIAPQRVALEVERFDAPGTLAGRAAFLEELIVRRELAENFCFYTPGYDTVDAFPAWARRSLDRHRADRRDHLYTREEFEAAATHDELWNAAQRELLFTGRMHGYMRMYWAKKILEWSSDPAEALDSAIALNDTHALDGNDPNGYAGIAWSVGGVHDRAWFDRPVFGMVRYMSAGGCKSKFDVQYYITAQTAYDRHVTL